MQTLTSETRYVLVFIAHSRRELVHVNATANPTAAWVWRQVIEATPWGHTPRHLLRDPDAVYGRDFRRRARRIGIDAIATPIRSPRANAIAERVIGTLRRECLDHLIILDEQHLRSVLAEFVGYYNTERPHRALRLEAPESAPRPVEGLVRSRPVLGGVAHLRQGEADCAFGGLDHPQRPVGRSIWPCAKYEARMPIAWHASGSHRIGAIGLGRRARNAPDPELVPHGHE